MAFTATSFEEWSRIESMGRKPVPITERLPLVETVRALLPADDAAETGYVTIQWCIDEAAKRYASQQHNGVLWTDLVAAEAAAIIAGSDSTQRQDANRLASMLTPAWGRV